MTQLVSISGRKGIELAALLSHEFDKLKPRAIGIASAYLSVFGVRQLLPVLRKIPELECRLVAGIDGAITHPSAIQEAKDAGWKVRVGRSSTGIFHPKLIVAGAKFGTGGLVDNIGFAYIGSGNYTRGGLKANLETVLLATNSHVPTGSAEAFAEIWQSSEKMNQTLLEAYTEQFSKAVRQRRPKDLEILGVSDGPVDEDVTPSSLKEKRPPPNRNKLIPNGAATLVWVGLESSTGEYQYQIEFPRALGDAISDMIADANGKPNIQVECVDQTRTMNFQYYPKNSMYRLNVPFDTPNARWARKHRRGIAVISDLDFGSASIELRILRPGPAANEVATKSQAMGAWGRTSTRSYGWL